jgi:hypothetical protein
MTPFLALRHPCRESFRGSGSRPNSLSSILAADGDSGAAGAVDGGSVVGPAANVIKELLYARVGVAGIVRREAAALGEFRVQVLEVLQGLLVQVLIDLNGNQLPACFAQRPRDPDR